MDILKLRNPIRNYAWGSRHALAEWMGRTAAIEPEAELWMGAHPRAPSQVLLDGCWVELGELLRMRAEEILGPRLAARWGPELPFLFKVLAVERPLSLQAHPDRDQARAGYARENQRGVPLDAPHRVYADPNHKPELVCALTRFTALKGFRPVEEIRRLLTEGGAAELAAELRGEPLQALPQLLGRLLSLEVAAARELVARVARASRARASDPVFAWTGRLASEHPADPAALAPLFLNLVTLAPGDALYLDAGELHCYLQGMAVELMANSDNVLRGGLTTKHIDREELRRVLRFDGTTRLVIRPDPVDPGIATYATPAEEFVLSRIEVSAALPAAPQRPTGAELLLCVEGDTVVSSSTTSVALRPGESVLVPFRAGHYTVGGRGLVYRASVRA